MRKYLMQYIMTGEEKLGEELAWVVDSDVSGPQAEADSNITARIKFIKNPPPKGTTITATVEISPQ